MILEGFGGQTLAIGLLDIVVMFKGYQKPLRSWKLTHDLPT